MGHPPPPPSLNTHARKRPGASARLVTIGIIVVGALLFWLLLGRRILRFATGQDIVDGVVVATPQPGQSTPAFVPIGQAPLAEDSIIVERIAEPDTEVPVRSRRQVIRYEIQEGDTIFGLAAQFGLEPDTIFWANTETLKDNVHFIQIGQPLYVMPTDGVYHAASGDETIADMATRFGVSTQIILNSQFNSFGIGADANYIPAAGQRIVFEGGSRDYISWSSPIIFTNIEDATSPEEAFHPGSCRSYYTGLGGSGEFSNPLSNAAYRVTNGFYSWHPGVDLAAPVGTLIYAADSGVVVFAGWHTDGYGNLIILDHGNGFTTYYAHMKSRFAECGQSLQPGELLGEVGSTGVSTGPHLHFEIRKEHVPNTPFLYFEIATRSDS